MRLFLLALAVASVAMGCSSRVDSGGSGGSGGGEGSGGDDGGGAGSTSSGWDGNCEVLAGGPKGACSEGDTCSGGDGGCAYEYFCRDGTWATAAACFADGDCPLEPPADGSACTSEGLECRYYGGGACERKLRCGAGAFVDVGCGDHPEPYVPAWSPPTCGSTTCGEGELCVVPGTGCDYSTDPPQWTDPPAFCQVVSAECAAAGVAEGEVPFEVCVTAAACGVTTIGHTLDTAKGEVSCGPAALDCF